MSFVDVHTHLTHAAFAEDCRDILMRASDDGLGAIVINGLEPRSNRQILALAEEFSVVVPALGIYPTDAVNDLLPLDFPHQVAKFAVDDEIKFIGEQAQAGKVRAVGECGLDGYWLGEETFAAQERVFEELIHIAQSHNIPIIIHSRKLEKRAMEILAHYHVKKVNFHCFCGKVKMAQAAAESHGWHFSIPANAAVNEGFRKMLASLPLSQILTETDAPYLAPVRGERNEPKNVRQTISILAQLRGLSLDQARDQVWRNYQILFS